MQKEKIQECLALIKGQQEKSWTVKSYEQLWNQIRERAESEYADFSAKLLPETARERVLGVRLPVLRKFAAAISKGDCTSYLAIVKNEAAKKSLSLEECMVWGFVIGHGKDWSQVGQQIRDFLPYIDNWSVCDSFCASLKITNSIKEEMYEFLQGCLESKQTYDQRFAFVMLLNYYIESDYLMGIFQACEKQEWKDYYTKMAVAWLLSMCYVNYKKETLEYLAGCHLDDFIYNKCIQKIIESRQVTHEEKQQIKTRKR